ncbi:MAG TPA: hypothetical protein VFO48_05240 [Vicinamibacterales bacterium]|nr:hypothetical protein [Vicinamibacterales bacterium]
MLKLLLGVVVEVAVALLIAGLILATAIPLLNHSEVVTVGDTASARVIIGVMVSAVAIALFRPGSAIRRFGKR